MENSKTYLIGIKEVALRINGKRMDYFPHGSENRLNLLRKL